jgi:hypothetical protein
MTYCDPRAWGDKCWPGFDKYFILQPEDQPLQEFICTPELFSQYDSAIGDQIEAAKPAASPATAPTGQAPAAK